MDECEICGSDNALDEVHEVVWNNGGIMALCITCRDNHHGEWTEVA